MAEEAVAFARVHDEHLALAGRRSQQPDLVARIVRRTAEHIAEADNTGGRVPLRPGPPKLRAGERALDCRPREDEHQQVSTGCVAQAWEGHAWWSRE